LPPGKIYNSNTYSTAAVVRYYGAIPSIIGVALDSQDSLMGLLEQGLDADMLITTGGVSMGDYDVVKDVLAKEGEMIFWRVRMKPGKPIAFGKLKGMTKDGIAKNILHLGLPGNPVSAMITFELFARPAILKMMGRQVSIEPVDDAILEEVIVNGDGRRVYARAIVEKRGDKYFARLTGPQGSGILTSMSSANALVIVPEDKPRVEKGDKIKFSMLSWKERSQWIDS
jgi:molybdopterin molybdotransferase